jgi:uncharacterized Zn finger protein
MASIDDLFAALRRAALANQRDEFDRHEGELLARFGGFQEMPREIYDRYLEVDRAWPATLSHLDDDTSSHVARLPLHARLPDELISWLQELGAETERNRSDVLATCLETIRGDATLRESVAAALRSGTPTSKHS